MKKEKTDLSKEESGVWTSMFQRLDQAKILKLPKAAINHSMPVAVEQEETAKDQHFLSEEELKDRIVSLPKIYEACD